MEIQHSGVELVARLSSRESAPGIYIESAPGVREVLSYPLTSSSDTSFQLQIHLRPGAAGEQFQINILDSSPALAQGDKALAAAVAYAKANRLRVVSSGESLHQALVEYEKSLTLWRDLGDQYQQARVLERMVETYGELSDDKKAIGIAQEAVPLWRAAGDRSGEASALGEIGLRYAYLGEHVKGRGYLEEALSLFQSVGDRAGEADCLNNIAITYSIPGDFQRAIHHYGEALRLSRAAADHRQEAYILKNMAMDYSSLGESEMALEQHFLALSRFRALEDRHGEAYALYSIGDAYLDLMQARNALSYYRQALVMMRAIDNRMGEAHLLHNIGLVYLMLGEPQKALDPLKRSVSLHREYGNSAWEAMGLANIGRANLEAGDPQSALPLLEQALPLVQGPWEEVTVLVHLARTERALGNLERARERAEQAAGLTEAMRSSVTEQKIRVAYFSTVRSRFDLLISILMALDRQHPEAGYAAHALEVSERARARGLLDLMDQSLSDLRPGVDANLLGQESELRSRLNQQLAAQIKLVSGKHTAQEAAAAEADVRSLSAQYENTLNELRAAAPHFSAFIRPEPLKLTEIQKETLDTDTVLLEYALCGDRSFLWAVTPDSMMSYELPPPSVIERAVRRVYEELSSNSLPATTHATKALSRILLSSVESQLGSKRLVVVAEGALQYIPFGALETSAGVRLVAQHEIVSLPSASTLAVLRRERQERTSSAKTVAVLADSVFDRHDPRLEHPAANVAPLPAAAALERSTKDAGLQHLERLVSSRREAEVITSMAGKNASLKALDFDASRTTATSPELSQYRIVHFASHGLLDSVHPELSGIVLSMVDRQGRWQNGFLQVHDIYALKLNADLVVLSACQTALGKDVRGEGIVGLTRGFMYAGVPRVVASLWRVPDQATAELMKRFYRAMLVDGLSPAAALGRAQVSMSREKRWTPYHWAGFVLQGEWR